jgi:ribosomal protein S18 acetylase RimI-like enzyme
MKESIKGPNDPAGFFIPVQNGLTFGRKDRHMTIIPATAADIPALVPLVNAAYRGQGDDSPKGWTSESHLIKGARTTVAGITELLQAPHSVILKCVDEKGALLGSVHLEKQEGRLYLGVLSVWPERQGHGIGKHLLAAAIDHATKNNCSNIHITVISARPELIAWYERHGYQRTGEIQPFHHGEKFGIQKQPLELVVLEKTI